MSDLKPFEGRVALVTGAAGHLAHATAAMLAAKGASIAAVDRPGASLDRLDGEVAPDRLLKLHADVRDADAVQTYVSETIERFGRIDILFNAAGIAGPVMPIGDYPVDTFRQIMDVNVVGVFLGLKFILPRMQAQRSGVVINACSVSGLRGSKGISAYSASKHAVLGLTRVAGNESAPHNVRVVGIAPGPTDSPMVSGHIAATAPDNQEEARASMLATIPAGRLGQAEEVAALVCFLASDLAAYINGITVPIDGALTAG